MLKVPLLEISAEHTEKTVNQLIEKDKEQTKRESIDVKHGENQKENHIKTKFMVQKTKDVTWKGMIEKVKTLVKVRSLFKKL